MFTHNQQSMERVVRVFFVLERDLRISIRQQHTHKGVSIERFLPQQQNNGCRTS
jgi:hypothetical protein